MTHTPDAPVRLSVPAATRYLSAARVVAAAVGAECGLSVDDLDDLRLGVNELMAMLIDGAPSDARVDLAFVADGAEVTVTGVLEGGPPGGVTADELTTRILEAVADHHAVDTSSFVLTKRSSVHDEP